MAWEFYKQRVAAAHKPVLFSVKKVVTPQNGRPARDRKKQY
jgi:hypothetical protein